MCVHACSVTSVMSNSATIWIVAHQALLSMGFPRQEHRSGLPYILLGIFLTQGSNPSLLQCRQILYHWANKKGCSLSHVQLFVVPWTVAHQAPLPTEFSRQEYWSGLPFFFNSKGSSNPGIRHKSLAHPTLHAILHHWATWDTLCFYIKTFRKKSLDCNLPDTYRTWTHNYHISNPKLLMINTYLKDKNISFYPEKGVRYATEAITYTR